MPDITTARKGMSEFLIKELNKEASQIKFIKITKTPEGWNGKIEITEENSHLTKLGKPSVFDRNVYIIDMDDALNVTNFCQEGAGEEEF